MKTTAWFRIGEIISAFSILILSDLLLYSGNASAQVCGLYPIALSQQQLSNVVPGTVFTNIYNGTQPGNFGWLSWGGSPSEPTLVASLTSPGNSSTYVNPDDSSDHQIHVGDWVQCKPGVSNSKNVQNALNTLETMDITVPIWDSARGQGANAAYRVAAFAGVRLLSYQLPGQNRITARFLGFVTCGVTNQPPVVNAGQDQTITLPNTVTLNGIVTDDGLPSGQTLIASWSEASGPAPVVFSLTGSTNALTGVPVTNQLATTVTFSVAGTYVLRLTASDAQYTSSNDVTVTVNRPNSPPVANSQSVALDENTSTNIVLNGSDPDGDPISYIIVTPPNYGALNGTPPNLVYTPIADFSGQDSFTFKTYDGSLYSSVATVDITIAHVNQQPVADTQSVTNNENTPVLISLSGSDVDGDSLTYRIVNSPTNGALTLSQQSTNAVQYTYTPATNYYGPDSFTFVANDGQTDSVPALVSIAVAPVDQPPLVEAGPDQMVVLPTNSITLNGSVTYAAFPDTVDTVQWIQISGPGTVAFSSPTNESTLATFSQSGVYDLELTASDSFLSETDDVVVTVDAPPTVSAGPNQTNVWPGSATLNGNVSDDGIPTNGVLTAAWSMVSGPGVVIFSNSNATNTGATFSQSGVYVLQLTANDGVAITISDVVVMMNQAPHVDAGNAQIITNFQAALQGSAYDDGLPNGTLTTVWTQVSGPGTALFANSNSPLTTVTFDQTGVYVLQLAASDALLQSSNQVTITVLQAPSVNITAPTLINWPSNQVTLNGTVTDDGLPAGGTLTTAWSEVSGPGTANFSPSVSTASLNGSTTTILPSATVSFTAPGTYVLQLTANDGVMSNSSSVTVILNRAPTVSVLADNTTVELPATVNLTGLVSDDGLPNGTLTYSWGQVSGPGVVTFSNPTGTNTIASFSAPGTYIVSLAANDSAATGSGAITLNILPINQPPVVNAGPAQTNLFPATVQLAGTASDDGYPLGSTLTVGWSLVSGPGTVSFNNPSQTNTTATFSQPGVYVLQLVASDSQLMTTSQVVLAEDAAPLVNAGTNQIVTGTNQVLLSGTVTDDGLPAGANLTATWEVVSGPGTASFSPVAQTNMLAGTNFTYQFPSTATFSQPGVYVLGLTADDSLATNSSQVTITLNQAPLVNAWSNQVISISDVARLHGSVTDDGLPFGAVVTTEWAKISGPGVVRFGDIHAADTTAIFSEPGIYTLRLIASDTVSTGNSTVSVTVTPLGVNQPPVVYAGTNQIIAGTNVASLNGVVTDDNFFGTGYLYSWWSVQSGPGTVSFANSNTPATTAAFSAAGTYVLKLFATDSQYTNADQVTITIYPDNQPPTVYPGPNQSIFTSTATLAGQVWDDGLPEGSHLTASWTQISGPGSVFFAVPSSAVTTVSFSQPGTYVLQLAASDTQYTVSSNVAITVQYNQAPVVSAGPDEEIVNTNQTTLQGWATDDGLPVGSTLSVTWSLVNGPSTAVFSDVHATNATVTFGDQGAYQLRLTATDGQLVNSDDVTIIVTSSNSIPYQATNILYRFATAISTNFYVTNLDESTFTNGQGGFGNYGFCSLNSPTYIHTYWPGAAGGVSFLLVRRHFYVPPGTTNLDMGFTVDNNAEIFINGVLISPSNVANPIYRGGFTYVAPWFDHSNCPNYDDLILSGISTNVWHVGNNLLTVQIYDDGGLAFFDARISPNNPTGVLLNQPPVPQVNTNQFVVYPSILTLLASVQDDGLPLNATKTATWSQVSGPGTVRFSRPAASFAISNDVSTLAAFSVPGTYQLQLTANDSDLSASTYVTVFVSTVTNAPPIVSAGPDQTIPLQSSAVLNGVATDDGFPFGTLTTSWSALSGPGSVSFETINGTNYASFSEAGDYVLQFSASDGQLSSSSNMTVHVIPPVGRSLNLAGYGPTETDLSVGANLLGQINDQGLPAGNVLTDAWLTASGPAQAAFTQTTANFPGVSAHVDFPVAGSYVLRLAAGDGQLSGYVDMPITVTDLYHGNRPPGVSAGPAMAVPVNVPVTLNGSATDNDVTNSGTFTTLWTQSSGPTAVIFANAALTNTTATFSAPGDYELQLTASDGQLSSSATVAIVVTNTSSSSLLVYAGGSASVALSDALDLDGAVLDINPSLALSYQWTNLSGPGTVTFATATSIATNVTTWLPVTNSEAVAIASFSVPGNYVFGLNGTDGTLTNSDTLTVTVLPDTNDVLSVDAGQPQTIVLPNVAALNPIVTKAGQPDGSATLTWSQVSGPGTATFNLLNGNWYAAFSAAGVYDLRLVATDGQLSASNDVAITVYETIPAPSVAIAAPDDGAIITAPTNIIGTASSPILQYYQLEYRLKNPDDEAPNAWVVFATGNSSVTNGVLGLLDPTMLLNGIYELQLVAFDTMGRFAVSPLQTFSVERNLKIGQFALSFQDLNVPVSGIPIQIVRTYDSRDQRSNDFGVGWSLDVRNIRLQKTRSLGPNWYQDYFFDEIFDSYTLDPIKPREITVTMAGDKVYHFQAVVTPEQQFFYPIEDVHMTFTNMPGTYGGLAIDGDNEATVDHALGYANLINMDDFSYFNPTRFRFTNEVGDVYIIDEKAGLQSLTDRSQNTLLIATNGIIWTNALTGNSGVGVSFVRDNFGRITNIIDPAGNALTYAYGTNGSLAAFTDRNTNTTTFAYTNANFPQYLTGITDPRGIQAIRTIYDDSGRMIQQIDADGNVINFTHDFSNDREEVTDRLGHTTVNYYDDRGNVLATIDALGNLTTYQYDDVDNLLVKVDALGNTNRYTYDGQGNKLTETDPLGYTTSYTYGPHRLLTSITTPRGYTTTNVYDPDSETLTSETDPLGNVTTYSYDLGGNLLTRTDALGNVISNSYDASGHVTSTTTIDAQRGVLNDSSFTYDANGNQLTKTTTRTTSHGVETDVTHYAYDSENRQIQTIHPDGSTNTLIYAVGLDKPAVQIDPLGHQTLYFYDERGNETNTVFADGTSESIGYDAENRKISSTDRAGRVTTYNNDALGRLTATQMPDGSVIQTAYDAIGREIATVDELGNTNRFEYDPNCGCSGRKTDEIDPLGHITHFTYDEDANRQTMVDALGRTETYKYDPLDRPMRTIYPDGTTMVTTYDAAGRRITETDQNTNTTWFAYDALGRLVSVTNALGKVTVYGYDELNNQVSQTDANHHTTTFEYDSMGHRIKRTLPGGQVESYTYDLAGNMTSKVDFNGRTTTYAYDAVNRLLTKTPDASFSAPSVAMTYTPTGQRTSMTDAGAYTAYLYNSRDWLTNKVVRFNLPSGTRYTSVLSYNYDAHGNLTHISSSDANGVRLDYTYDALNRLENVNDAQAGTTSYGYDAVGNLIGYVFPNNVSSTYAYDSLNRLTNLATVNAQLAPVALYQYTVAAGGQRLTANENVVLTNGVRTINREYSYDATYRLTHEGLSVTDPVAAPVTAGVGYTLDDVGNRLARTSTLSQIPSTSSSFDADDRLNSDTYDANGNTTAGQVTSSAPAVSDQYDFEDRLINRNNGQIIITYDGDGNRLSKTVDGVTTLYLVDDQNPSSYAQVLEELTSTGGTPVVTRTYAYGHSIISQTFAPSTLNPQPSTSFYGTDGHGNVRYLTDISGALTDSYDYDACGNLIAQNGTTANSYLYCAERFDTDLGLYYNRARYLNTDSGRFWTMDVFSGVETDPYSLHSYLYTEVDPINHRDPSGFFEDWLLGIFVHNAIGIDFLSRNTGYYSYEGEEMANNVSNRSVGRGYANREATPGTDWAVRPDLVSVPSGEVYEIKSEGNFGEGLSDLKFYIGVLKQARPDKVWIPGTSFVAKTPISVFGVTVNIDPPSQGVIIYHYGKGPDGTPLVIPIVYKIGDVSRRQAEAEITNDEATEAELAPAGG